MRTLFFICLKAISKLMVMASLSVGLAIVLTAWAKVETGVEDDFESALNATLVDLVSLKERNVVMLFIPYVTL